MHQRLLASCAVVLLVAFAAADVSTQGPTYTFTTIEVPGAMRTAPIGINDRGEIVGWFYDASGVRQWFLRSNGTFTVIDGPPGSTLVQEAPGINNRGEIVGQTSTGIFVLSGGQFTIFGAPSLPDDINDLGQIVGVVFAGGGVHGYLRSHGLNLSIDFPDPTAVTTLRLSGINAAGQVTGFYRDADFRNRGFRLGPDGEAARIDVPGATSTEPLGINDRGEIVGQQVVDGVTSGFLLAYGNFTTITVPGAVSTRATDINNRGQIVGQWSHSPLLDSGSLGFLATPSNEAEDLSGGPSPEGTRVPVSPAIFDADLARWTLGPGQEILREGAQVGGGYASQILWSEGTIYVRGEDSNWWRWTGSVWAFAGSQDPEARRGGNRN